jgi:hypothetical protein
MDLSTLIITLLAFALAFGLTSYVVYHLVSNYKSYNYIKVDYYKRDMTKKTLLIKPNANDTITVEGKEYLINPNHVFKNKKYRYIIINEGATENLNPLNFKSKYNVEMFTTAINNKVIKDTFAVTGVQKLDVTRLLLIGILVLQVIIVYFMLKQNGAI